MIMEREITVTITIMRIRNAERHFTPSHQVLSTRPVLASKASLEASVITSQSSSESLPSPTKSSIINVSEIPHSLWNVQEAINTINQTYEIDETLDAWNYRSHALLTELRDQTELFSCSGGVWTQTTDVEGEVNGLLTYDRRILRPDVAQWKKDIEALYNAAKARSNSSVPAR
jgi:hypothetical protein